MSSFVAELAADVTSLSDLAVNYWISNPIGRVIVASEGSQCGWLGGGTHILCEFLSHKGSTGAGQGRGLDPPNARVRPIEGHIVLVEGDW